MKSKSSTTPQKPDVKEPRVFYLVLGAALVIYFSFCAVKSAVPLVKTLRFTFFSEEVTAVCENVRHEPNKLEGTQTYADITYTIEGETLTAERFHIGTEAVLTENDSVSEITVYAAKYDHSEVAAELPSFGKDILPLSLEVLFNMFFAAMGLILIFDTIKRTRKIQ